MKNRFTAYLEFIRETKSPKTYAMYTAALKEFVFVVGKNVQLTKESYVTFLRKTTGMHPATQALYRSAIKGLYLFAADTDPNIPTTFFDQTNKRLALKPGRRLPMFNREGIEKIIAHCNTIRNNLADLRDRAFIFLLADSGLRVSEACQLRVGSIDLLECKALVIGKGNKQALVQFSNRAADAIREYLQARQGVVKSLPVFIRHTKKAGDKIISVKPADMWHAIKARAEEAGVDPTTIHAHSFRHYFVTYVLASSHDLKLAQELARHEKIETTGRYAHLVGDAGQAYDKIFNKR